MLYKVTPMMTPPEGEKPKKARREPGQPRKRRKTAIYDGEGHEVLITLMCLKCKGMKPLAQFGLRKMADGAIRNQPWCRTCRSQAGTKPVKKDEQVAEAAPQVQPTVDAPIPAPVPVMEAQAEETSVVEVTPEVSSQDDESTQPMAEQAASSDVSEVDGTLMPTAAEPDPSYSA